MNKLSATGGKGKGLVWLAENTDIGYEVPEFDILDSSYHEDVLKQRVIADIVAALQTKVTGQPHIGKVTRIVKRLEDRCYELANQFNGTDIMVRSSAVISEDSDRFSGAGIHDSFEIRAADLSPQTLLDSVLKVYASVDSERAKQYRRVNNLGEERMEVVVQRLADGHNGVAMSRLQARAGIKPISWSDVRGAVVGSSNVGDARVYTAFFTPRGKGYVQGSNRILFQTEDARSEHVECLEDTILPIVDKIKKRYGKEFELEFVVDLPYKYNQFDETRLKPAVHLVQIRPLTNIQNKKIKFPNKESLMEAEFCVGVGEYIGRWITPQQVKEGWNEPNHYAYVSARLEKMMPSFFGNGMGGRFGLPEESHKDYDRLTPNKMAMVITSPLGGTSMHALTIANERGIICLAGNITAEVKKSKRSKLDELDDFNRSMARGLLGAALTEPIQLNVPLDEVGQYVHVVSDGLKGRVYRATEEEVREFEKRLTSNISYAVSPVTGSHEDEKWWNLEFQIIPSSSIVSLDAIWKDFIYHMKQMTGKQLGFKRDDRFAVYNPSAEFEVYCAYFDPAKRHDGIKLETGRSASEIADRKTTQALFQEFADRVKSKGYYPSSDR